MVKKHVSKSNAQRCKEYRQRIKTQKEKDQIEKNLDKRVKSAKKEQKTENKENKINVDALDADWLEPHSNLREQFQISEEPHYSLFGDLEGTQNPLDKVSHAQNLKALFGNRAE